MARRLLGLTSAMALASLAACQRSATDNPPTALRASVHVEEEAGWRSAATEEDLERLGRVDTVWQQALEQGRRSGFARQILAEGRLLQPGAALARPSPTPGSYSCRLIRFGSERPRGRVYTAFRPFFCHVGVEDEMLSLTKQTGSERPGGYLWEDEDRRRLIFLGALALGDAETPGAYGENSQRDLAGVFERVGPFRYRLVIPRLRQGLILDVLELIPAPVQLDTE